MKEYELKVTLIDRKFNTNTVVKAFSTAKARAKWIEVNDGKIYEILGFRDPEPVE